MVRTTTWAVLLTAGALLACKGGKAKTETFAALDKHAIDYGRCEVMNESKEEVNGKPAWIAATLCRAQFKKKVMDELSDTKKFEDYFEEWKKEKGAKAIADARAAPADTSAPAAAAGSDDCPNGAGCLNRCRSECEGKHGKLMDLDKMRDCTKGGGGAECVTKATNQETRKCFFGCRGLPMPD